MWGHKLPQHSYTRECATKQLKLHVQTTLCGMPPAFLHMHRNNSGRGGPLPFSVARELEEISPWSSDYCVALPHIYMYMYQIITLYRK